MAEQSFAVRQDVFVQDGDGHNRYVQLRRQLCTVLRQRLGVPTQRSIYVPKTLEAAEPRRTRSSEHPDVPLPDRTDTGQPQTFASTRTRANYWRTQRRPERS